MGQQTLLRKRMIRRHGKLVIELTKEGIGIKGFRRHDWFRVTYADLARFIVEKNPPAGGLTARQWADVLKTIGAK